MSAVVTWVCLGGFAFWLVREYVRDVLRENERRQRYECERRGRVVRVAAERWTRR